MNNLSIEKQLKHLRRILKEERERLEDLEDKVAIQEAFIRGIDCAYAVLTAEYSMEEQLEECLELQGL